MSSVPEMAAGKEIEEGRSLRPGLTKQLAQSAGIRLIRFVMMSGKRGFVDSPGDITVLLRDWSKGNDDALNRLFELMYPKLRYLAAALVRREQPGTDLQPTGIANELYLKLVEQKRLQIEDRAHFLSLAARFMRRILVDQGRRRHSLKRDGGERIQLTDDLRWVAEAEPQLLDLDRALEELRAIDERKCRMIDLRYFLGFGPEETAELLGISKATLNRELRFARAWIQERLGQPVGEG